MQTLKPPYSLKFCDLIHILKPYFLLKTTEKHENGTKTSKSKCKKCSLWLILDIIHI